MQKELLEWFDSIFGSARPEPTIEQRNGILDNWKTYFIESNIKEDKQFEAFKSIMKVRGMSGVISISPPKVYKKKEIDN